MTTEEIRDIVRGKDGWIAESIPPEEGKYEIVARYTCCCDDTGKFSIIDAEYYNSWYSLEIEEQGEYIRNEDVLAYRRKE